MRISVISVLLAFVACGPSVEPASPDAGLTDAGVLGTDAGPSSDAGPPDAGSVVDLPVVTSATVVTHGSIRVQWTNPNSPCEALALTRSKDGASPVAASQPAAGATQTMDAPGHASGTYCYALICSRAGVAQGTSNQKCATQ